MSETFNDLLSIAMMPAPDIPESTRVMARLSLFDWLVVAHAGRDEPLSHIVRKFVRHEGGDGVATVFGDLKVPARAAALANGTISHALDYDDTHFGHIGHLSVGIMPAVFAVAEGKGVNADEMLDAFIIGAEVAIRLGMYLGRAHYQRGFHQTATSGAFGATVAAGRILELTKDEMRHALNLVATRASGLKSQFGTMGKPFNAGIAASNGVEAAQLAQLGFQSCDDGIFGDQGFAKTHSDDTTHGFLAFSQKTPQFLFEDIKYKLHACCHGTHAMIEALHAAIRSDLLQANQVVKIRLRVNPRWLSVCDHKQPRTGLEVKFSYVWLAGMVFSGINTSADKAYTDALCCDVVLTDFATRVEIVGDEMLSDTSTSGEIETSDGRLIPLAFDLADRVDPSELKRGLLIKAQNLIGNIATNTFSPVIESVHGVSTSSLARLIGVSID